MAPLSDRVLMGPGPCNPYPEAVAALGVDLILLAALGEAIGR